MFCLLLVRQLSVFMRLCKFVQVVTLKNRSTATLLTLPMFFYVFYAYISAIFSKLLPEEKWLCDKNAFKKLAGKEKF